MVSRNHLLVFLAVVRMSFSFIAADSAAAILSYFPFSTFIAKELNRLRIASPDLYNL